MRFVRTCKLIQQSRLATRNFRNIRKTRSAAIAKFLEEQNIARFRKTPAPEPEPGTEPEPSSCRKRAGPKRRGRPKKELSNNLITPSDSIPMQSPPPKQPSVSSCHNTNTTHNVTLAATLTSNKYTVSKSTQSDLALTDAHEGLINHMNSKGIDVVKINSFLRNEDYVANYEDLISNENPDMEMYDENDNMNTSMSGIENSSFLTGCYALAQEQARLHWFSRILMNSVNHNPHKSTLIEYNELGQLEQQQDLYIEEL